MPPSCLDHGLVPASSLPPRCLVPCLVQERNGGVWYAQEGNKRPSVRRIPYRGFRVRSRSRSVRLGQKMFTAGTFFGPSETRKCKSHSFTQTFIRGRTYCVLRFVSRPFLFPASSPPRPRPRVPASHLLCPCFLPASSQFMRVILTLLNDRKMLPTCFLPAFLPPSSHASIASP